MRRSNQGLTLVEVLVALVFTGVAFTALALSQVTGFKVTRSSQEAAVARDLATKQLELFRSYGFEPYSECSTFDPEDQGFVGFPPCEATVTSDEYPRFTIHWLITDRPRGTPLMSKPALLEIQVEVTWDDKSYELTSYLSCGDPGEYATTKVPCPTESLLGP